MKNESAYTRFALVREMMETPCIIRNFRTKGIEEAVKALKKERRLFLTGEGSSRIFPAKNAMAMARRKGMPLSMAAEGGRQAAEYDLNGWTVFGASNSGQTKEVISLFNDLKKERHPALFGLTANQDTKLATLCKKTFVLSCGREEAVAATKSVVEQALFYVALLSKLPGSGIKLNLKALSIAFEKALTMPVDPSITAAIADAGTICFSGRNNGAAEELTLKTNEITRKKSDFFEGTYAVHGVEEVLNPEDVVILIDPFKEEIEKFKTSLVDGVKMKVFAIASEETPFPTLRVPDAGAFSPFVHLAAGWNLLVEAGLRLNINLDKPVRARKIGNEFIP